MSLTFLNDRGIPRVQMNSADGEFPTQSHQSTEMHAGLYAKCPLFLFGFEKEIETYRHILVKVLNIKFRENPFSHSRVVACGQTDGHCGFNRCSRLELSRVQISAPRYKKYIFGVILFLNSGFLGCSTV
jgi:hypothetical protein